MLVYHRVETTFVEHHGFKIMFCGTSNGFQMFSNNILVFIFGPHDHMMITSPP